MAFANVKTIEEADAVFDELDKQLRPELYNGDLGTEIRHWAPDIDQLTFGHRLTYEIKSNWKNVVDNFLECYHCPTAHYSPRTRFS